MQPIFAVTDDAVRLTAEVEAVAPDDRIRLVAVSQLNNVNDCYYLKQSLRGMFFAGPRFAPRAGTEPDAGRVPAFACVEVVLSPPLLPGQTQ